MIPVLNGELEFDLRVAPIDLARIPTAEYRAVMAELFTTEYPMIEGFLCTYCPDARPHIHARP